LPESLEGAGGRLPQGAQVWRWMCWTPEGARWVAGVGLARSWTILEGMTGIVGVVFRYAEVTEGAR
jgi:hypothetical protein